jgi:hypothetical protein
MPTRGLSLVGFMQQDAALHHLRQACVPPDPADAALLPVWRAATANLGTASPNAGKPNIEAIPAANAAYVNTLLSQAWVHAAFQGPLKGSEIKLVEIDEMLAFQFTVDLDRADHHCGPLSKPPTIDELLHTCLPINPIGEALSISTLVTSPNGGSAVIRARSLNVRMVAQGIFNDPGGNPFAAGFQFGPALPLVQAVRLNGRVYLHNGFHRAVGARAKGATHIPCVLRDVQTPDEAAIRADGSTFELALLESANPPSVGHFTSGRAQSVLLRLVSQVMHVSWARHVVADE